MQELTLHEKRTIFQILILIMKADMVIDPAEEKYLDHIFNTFKLDIAEFDHMEMIELDHLTNEFSSFSTEIKSYARKLFVEMSRCDGFEDPREIEIIDGLFIDT